MNSCQRTRRHYHTAIRGVGEGRNTTLDLAGIAHVDRTHFYPKRRCHSLDGAELADPGGYTRIPNDCRARHSRRYLLQQFHPFPTDTVLEHKKAGDVATRSRQAVDEASPDRIRDDHKHSRYAASRLEQRPQG